MLNNFSKNYDVTVFCLLSVMFISFTIAFIEYKVTRQTYTFIKSEISSKLAFMNTLASLSKTKQGVDFIQKISKLNLNFDVKITKKNKEECKSFDFLAKSPQWRDCAKGASPANDIIFKLYEKSSREIFASTNFQELKIIVPKLKMHLSKEQKPSVYFEEPGWFHIEEEINVPNLSRTKFYLKKSIDLQIFSVFLLFLSILVLVFWLFSTKKRHSEQLKVTLNKAHYDELTNLLNRRGLTELVPTLDKNCIVFMVDVDNLKSINDRFGHAMGDELLKVVSKSLNRSMRANDLICRWAGDEFILVAKNVTSDKSARVIIEKINNNISSEMLCNTVVSASIGYALLSEFNSFYSCLSAADAAMYQHKLMRRQSLSIA